MQLTHDTSKALQSELKRNGLELVEYSINKCNTSKSYRHVAVHDIRKNLKKIRALLRLIRFGVGDDIYKENNVWFRDTGRIISEIRDASSLLEILDKLQDKNSTNIKPQYFNLIRVQLKSYRRKLSRKIFTDEEAIGKVESRLNQSMGMVKTWPIENLKTKHIRDSITQVYERGHQARLKALDTPTAENYHEWRKRVKYLMYQLRFLEPIWPKIVSSMELELQLLSDYLGEDHDLAILKQATEHEIITFSTNEEKVLFNSIIDAFSKELREMIYPLGTLIFAESPKAYSKRIAIYMKVNALV